MKKPRVKRKTPDLVSEVLAGSDAEQGHKEKLVRYSEAKRHQKDVLGHILDKEPTLIKEYDALKDCGSFLTFRNFYTVNQYRLIAGCSCKKHLLCALCALRRSAKQVKQYEGKLYQVLSEKPDLVPVLITLTIKNGSDLAERTRHLAKAIRSMAAKRRRAAGGCRDKTIFSLLAGAAGAYEFKKGSGSNLWHPHIHMLGLLPQGVNIEAFQAALSKEWLKMTCDSHQVDVRKIDMNSEESRFSSICEVFRYALKFGEMEIEDQVHAYKVLRGKQFVFSFGDLRGVKISENDNDSVEDALALLPYIDIIYKYIDATGFTFFDTTDLGREMKKARPGKMKATKAVKKMANGKGIGWGRDRAKYGSSQQTVDAKSMQDWCDDRYIKPVELSKVPF
jgi:plasmid rolling circle replication initiator protein Rep